MIRVLVLDSASTVIVDSSRLRPRESVVSRENTRWSDRPTSRALPAFSGMTRTSRASVSGSMSSCSISLAAVSMSPPAPETISRLLRGSTLTEMFDTRLPRRSRVDIADWMMPESWAASAFSSSKIRAPPLMVVASSSSRMSFSIWGMSVTGAETITRLVPASGTILTGPETWMVLPRRSFLVLLVATTAETVLAMSSARAFFSWNMRTSPPAMPPSWSSLLMTCSAMAS